MDNPTKIRIDFKNSQRKSFASGKNLNTFATVAKQRLAEGELNGVQQRCEFVPDIHYNELDNLNESFSELMQPIALIVDITTRSDEHFGVNSRASENNSFVTQALIGIWSVAHHLSEKNMLLFWSKDGRGSTGITRMSLLLLLTGLQPKAYPRMKLMED